MPFCKRIFAQRNLHIHTNMCMYLFSCLGTEMQSDFSHILKEEQCQLDYFIERRKLLVIILVFCFQDYYDEKDDSGFSNVFPLWRDFGRESSLGIDDEEKPNLFSPKK